MPHQRHGEKEQDDVSHNIDRSLRGIECAGVDAALRKELGVPSSGYRSAFEYLNLVETSVS